MRLVVRAGVAACAGALAGAPGGCLDADTRKQMADSDSILGPIFKQPTPADAAGWAADQYSADKRARGTALLISAPFGGEEPYLAMYRQYVKDDYTNVRAVAARGLGLHGKPEDVPLLTPLLSDQERIVRLEAAVALQRLHNAAAIEPLADRLNSDKEPEAAVRAACATALGQYATNRSLQALIAALADDSLTVTYAAHESLRTLTGQDQFTDDRREWATWERQTRTPFAMQRDYQYPVFHRDKRWLDYLPFMPTVPNEEAARPVGMPEIVQQPGVAAPGATPEK
jgi:hypothetical protein